MLYLVYLVPAGVLLSLLLLSLLVDLLEPLAPFSADDLLSLALLSLPFSPLLWPLLAGIAPLP
jgi:hypothetical protein